MNPALGAILIQALGSAATVLASIMVAWKLGLAAQGEFALLRSWSDALTALLCIGLPQGLLHLVYREGVPAAALTGFVWRVTAAVAAVAVLVGALAWWRGLGLPVPREPLVVVAAALPFWVGQRLWRSLLLKDRGVVVYAVVTAMPAVLIFVGAAVMAITGRASGFEWVLLAAAVVAAILSAAAVGRGAPPHDRLARAQAHQRMWSISLQTWVQGLLAAALPAMLLSLVGLMGATLAEVGILSIGLQVYALFAVLATYGAPMVFDRAARQAAPRGTSWFDARARRQGLPMLAAAAVAAVLLPGLAAYGWPAFAEHRAATTVMAFAGLLALAVRLWSAVLQARAQTRELSRQAAWRFGLAGALAAWWHEALGAALAVSLALVVVEAATLLRLAWHERSLR